MTNPQGVLRRVLNHVIQSNSMKLVNARFDLFIKEFGGLNVPEDLKTQVGFTHEYRS